MMQSLIGVFIENFPQSINGQCFHHLRTSKLICIVNHLTGFYMMTTFAFKSQRVNKYYDLLVIETLEKSLEVNS